MLCSRCWFSMDAILFPEHRWCRFIPFTALVLILFLSRITVMVIFCLLSASLCHFFSLNILYRRGQRWYRLDLLSFFFYSLYEICIFCCNFANPYSRNIIYKVFVFAAVSFLYTTLSSLLNSFSVSSSRCIDFLIYQR